MNDVQDHHKVVVIGAGITGLTTAHHLHHSGVDVVVLEKAPQPGGTMTTLQKDGWVIERGPNSGLETTPLLGELFNELGLQDQLLYANKLSDKRYVLRGGVLHPIPMSPVLFIKSKLWSASGKLRIFKEPFVGRADKEESIAEFVSRRLGRELLDYAINPFVAGVYAGDPAKLSVQAAFPKLYALEEKYGGLIKGTFMGARERKKRKEKAKDRSRQFSFKGGMQTLPDAIARELGDRVICDVDIQSISMNPGSGEERFLVKANSKGKEIIFGSDILVMAIPSFAAAKYLKEYDLALSDALASIYYPPVAEVFLGYRKEDVGINLDGFGFLVPEKEKRKILGTIWSSTIFEGRAPEGFEGFTTFAGGSRQPDMASFSDDELLETVHAELVDLMHFRGKPVLSYINRWERAIPQYQLGHNRIIKQIENFENRNHGLILGGNFRGGISVSDCVISAHGISGKVKSLLAS